MNGFWKVTEDPMYDEDGVLVDEDYDEEQGQRVFQKIVEELSPHNTVNS